MITRKGFEWVLGPNAESQCMTLMQRTGPASSSDQANCFMEVLT